MQQSASLLTLARSRTRRHARIDPKATALAQTVGRSHHHWLLGEGVKAQWSKS